MSFLINSTDFTRTSSSCVGVFSVLVVVGAPRSPVRVPVLGNGEAGVFLFFVDGKAGVGRLLEPDVFFDIEAGLTVAACDGDDSSFLLKEFSGNCG